MLRVLVIPATFLLVQHFRPAHGDETLPLMQTFVDELVEITPGERKFPAEFQMGSNAEESEQPVHPVRLQHSFAIGRYEVPQNLYEAVMDRNPSRWKGPRNSAEMMTWHQARTFCEKLTAMLHEAKLIAADEIIRLPSEAEWEYCCRAGTTSAYSFGYTAITDGDSGDQASLLDPYAWHTGNAAGNDPPVGALKPNAWGLYDMHGYLREFTSDAWHADYTEAPADGSAWTAEPDQTPQQVVVRGGSWKDAYPALRSSARQPFAIDARDDAVGFRCVRSRVR